MTMPSIPLPPLTEKEVSLAVIAYVLGTFTAGYYWVRWRKGLDIRQVGSGNVGARNVGRITGATGFLVTLLWDVTKGAMAVALATYFHLSDEGTVACILAVVAGHNWPVQLRFHGGKGVATSVGAILAYDPWAALVLCLTFLPLWAIVRSLTLSGLLAFAVTPLVLFIAGFGNPVVAALSFLALMLLITHRKNIREEIAGILPGRAVKHAADENDKERTDEG
jgi:acyl phosphate:glycerol-3-phosphate acyltransferase